MYLFDWTFRVKDSSGDADDSLWLHTSLERNGQIVGDVLYGWQGDSLRLSGTLPRIDSLSPEHHSKYVRRDLVQLRERCLSDDLIVHPSSCEPKHHGSLEGIERLMIQTSVGDQVSPLLSGFDRRPVPLYLIPMDPDELERFFFWAKLYQHFHGIELACGVLERETLLQMSQPTSMLMQEAGEHAAKIEAATGIPTYIWLARYYGPPTGDALRPCPMCGGPWRQPEADPDAFRCDPCRLISVHAASLELEDWQRFRPDRDVG